MPKLTIQEDYKATGEFDIPEGKSIVGRGPDANLVLNNHAGVSREHCQLTCQQGRVVLEDLGSRNGTFLNGKPLMKPTELKHHDYIQIDDVLLIFSAMSQDGDIDSQTLLSGKDEDMPDYNKLSFVKESTDKLLANISKVIQGKEDVILHVIVALLSDGHVLLEDVPGVGKTKLAQALARSINTDFKRIQFTPDMLPNDVTGVNIYDEASKKFVFMPGPIFSNVVLADEINRGTPRVQSSLLECMAESSVTIDGSSYILHKPFFVIATQNPVDYHGTYPLPEAQLDRFLMRLTMGYPDADTEKRILESHVEDNPLTSLGPVLEASDLLHCQALVRTVYVSEQFRDYLVTLINKTRSHPAFAFGCSPRATLALMRASQALAAIKGRDHVMPRDARDLAVHVLAHRMPLKLQARTEWSSTARVLEDILRQMPMSKWEN
ncbi:MAG: AAA family ATPase [Victivallales bacterium]|nr:AAA family ATPase [Victivallales bacterium]